MALSDEDFNIEDEIDYGTSDSENINHHHNHNNNTNNNMDESEDSNGTTQSELDSDDETTQSEFSSSDDNDDSDSQSDTDSDSDTDFESTPTPTQQLTDEQQQKLAKQEQMAKAEQDLKNIHKKLRKIIEEKLQKKKTATKKYRDKCKEADDEYLQQCEADMDDQGIIDVLQEQPSLINLETGVLRNYQLDGLNWLIRVQETGLNAILPDEMGLGKTLQCIALLAYNCQYKRIHGPHLIVVPKSTLFLWKKEFESWCPCFRIFLLDGDKFERKDLLDEYINSVLDERNLDFDVCITSYEQCNIESLHLQKINWFYIVVDEAHRMKNVNAKLSQTMRSFESFHRLLITGTPLQNNLHELWALLNFLIPQAFKNAHSFDILYEAQQNYADDSDFSNLINNMLSEMHNLLRPLMLRRLKYDVEKSLPPKTEMILYVGMSTLQIALYKSLLSKNIGVLKETIKSKKALLNTAMQLRKVCNHPYLFENVEDRSLPIHGLHVINNSAKLCMLNKLLPSLYANHSKCLIFCQMTRMLDILDDYCFIKGYKRCRIDGNTAGHDRQSQMDDFNCMDPPSDKFIFLLSTRAGGLGINLVAADVVIFYDSDWNPQMDLQAQDRAHRIGQTKPVKIFRLISKNTIEEKILERAQLKLNLDELVIQTAAKMNNKNKKKTVSKNEVSAMIKYGISEIIALKENDNTLSEMNEMSIEEILSKGKQASNKLNELMAKHARNKFSIKSSDYSLLEDCKLDSDVFRTLAKIKKQNHNQNNNIIGGRTTNNSSNGYIKSEMDDFDKKIKAINKKSNLDRVIRRINDLEMPEKAPKMDYFQFFNKELLAPLYEKQWLWYNKYKTVEQDMIEKVENYERYGLNEYESDLKESLLSESFGDWNYKHMWAYVKCCTDYGRENIDMICRALPMKTRDEIIRYSKTFFENAKNDAEINKKIQDIRAGESQIERYIKYNQLLRKKISLSGGDKYAQSEMEFSAPYDHRAHGWRVEHDRFIVMKATQIGYGDWPRLKEEVLKAKQFRFDYFAQSRCANDINKRMRQLRPSIEKELNQHIRIFDRKTDAKEMRKRKQKEIDRHNNHLKYLKKEYQQIEAIKQEQEAIASNMIKQEGSKSDIMKQEIKIKKEKKRTPPPIMDEETPPPRKRQKQELPTPPPVLPNIHDIIASAPTPTNIQISNVVANAINPSHTQAYTNIQTPYATNIQPTIYPSQPYYTPLYQHFDHTQT